MDCSSSNNKQQNHVGINTWQGLQQQYEYESRRRRALEGVWCVVRQMVSSFFFLKFCVVRITEVDNPSAQPAPARPHNIFLVTE